MKQTIVIVCCLIISSLEIFTTEFSLCVVVVILRVLCVYWGFLLELLIIYMKQFVLDLLFLPEREHEEFRREEERDL
jgi:hypothetical protein